MAAPCAESLGAQPASDLFHGQHAVSKATCLYLARQVKQAAAVVAAAEASLEATWAAARAYHAQVPHPRGRPTALAARIEAAVTDLVQTEPEQTQALARHTQAREPIRELGILYHPYDLSNGHAPLVARVTARFADVCVGAPRRRGRLARVRPRTLRQGAAPDGPVAGHPGLLLGDRSDPGRRLGPGSRHGVQGPDPVDSGALSGAGRRASHPRRGLPATHGAERAVARTRAPVDASAAGPGTRMPRTHRGGRHGLCRSVSAQPFLRGRAQWPPVAVSSR